jgi:cephalosporin-C deacetylase-like acetyl esterase
MKIESSRRRPPRLPVAACLVILLTSALAGKGYSLEINLACPWDDTCSPPQTPFLSFHSTRSQDLLFSSGEEIEIICQAGLRAVALPWSLHRNGIATPFRKGEAEALPAHRFRIAVSTAGLHPGFYDLQVVLDTGMSKENKEPLARRPVKGVCTFGWKASEMAVASTRPADFAQFWAQARAKLAKIPLDAQLGPVQSWGSQEINAYNPPNACLPANFDPAGRRADRVESCKVSMAGPDGGRVYGWLAKPEGPGPFPAMLVLPGAGFNARPRPLEHARHGYVALDIQIHGQDVDLPRYEQIPGYYDHCTYEPVDAFYYYNVHLRCLQALSYLASRPDVDPARIVVVGGSQGGRLAVVIAGLDPRVAAAVPAIAHSGNHPHLRWVARCNGYPDLGSSRPDPKIAPTDGMDVAGAPPVLDDAVARCLAYYDPGNFAPDVRCPILFNAGLIDPVSPPSSVFAVFNNTGSATKSMIALDGMGHDWCPEFDRRAFRWLDKTLGLPDKGTTRH